MVELEGNQSIECERSPTDPSVREDMVIFLRGVADYNERQRWAKAFSEQDPNLARLYISTAHKLPKRDIPYGC